MSLLKETEREMELEENKVQTYEWLKEVVRLKCRRLRGRFTRTPGLLC